MTKRIRKQYDGAFKLKVILETYKNEKTLAQIASEYQVHATQIHSWKNQFKLEGPAIFQKAKDQEKAELKELVDELYKRVGQLKVERDWLKKKSEMFD
ncbi:transposase [Candidatus Peregrinibacteria bacterium]|nr:transposase [Candidatus Peregrinibacteria bacterium]